MMQVVQGRSLAPTNWGAEIFCLFPGAKDLFAAQNGVQRYSASQRCDQITKGCGFPEFPGFPGRFSRSQEGGGGCVGETKGPKGQGLGVGCGGVDRVTGVTGNRRVEMETKETKGGRGRGHIAFSWHQPFVLPALSMQNNGYLVVLRRTMVVQGVQKGRGIFVDFLDSFKREKKPIQLRKSVAFLSKIFILWLFFACNGRK